MMTLPEGAETHCSAGDSTGSSKQQNPGAFMLATAWPYAASPPAPGGRNPWRRQHIADLVWAVSKK